VAEYLIRKLERFVRLSAAEKQLLGRLGRTNVRRYSVRQDIVQEGDVPGHVNLMLQGFACRYKSLEDGRRQIVGFFIPGDLCDSRIFILKHMDHSIGTMSNAIVAEIQAAHFVGATDSHPRLARALWWNTLVEEAIAREWIVNVGQRSALERMAHLLCELFVRLQVIGLVDGRSCELPMTQTELSEALGLSTVHTNRTIQALRADGLITLRDRTLVVHDLRRLMDVGLFNPAYLHLNREGAELDANDV
jgi:CRP-like cAMP-binding protein